VSRTGSGCAFVWALLAIALAAVPAASEISDARESSGAPQWSSPSGTNPAAQAGPADPDQYRVGPGDALTLWMWGPIARTTSLEVGPDGLVFLPDLGPVRLAGLTLAEARRLLVGRVTARYRGVEVAVQLQHVRSFVVYLGGLVRQPGPVVTTGLSRLPDVLPDTLFEANASRRNILVRHLDGSETVCDLGRFLSIGGLELLPLLRDGDAVEVPPATRFVGVWGAVGWPRRLELGPRDSVSTLLRLAAGPLPSALRDRALLLRWHGAAQRDSVWVSLDAIESGRWDTPLVDGDNLYVFGVPEYRPLHQVSVVGQVALAGNYPVRLGVTRLSEVIRAAGGFRPEADSAAILLIRARPDGDPPDAEFERLARLSREQMTMSEYESFRTRLAALVPNFRVDWRTISQGRAELDPFLQPDDVVRVERLTNMVRVDGQVRQPGLVKLSPGESWRYYVRSAGGFTARAAHSQVRITRSASGQTALARNVDAVASGDFVWVPERPDISTWQHLKDVLTISAAFATIAIAFRR
jgi:protein involved in polysaccharide export with SLBB domain